jgi:hypothetical protein
MGSERERCATGWAMKRWEGGHHPRSKFSDEGEEVGGRLSLHLVMLLTDKWRSCPVNVS